VAKKTKVGVFQLLDGAVVEGTVEKMVFKEVTTFCIQTQKRNSHRKTKDIVQTLYKVMIKCNQTHKNSGVCRMIQCIFEA